MGEIAALRREVRGMATAIDSFDGTGDLETWLFDFESLAAHQGLEEDVAKARLLSFNLTGEAKRRFHALAPEQRTDYNAIKTCLRNTFKLTKGAKQKLKVKFYQRKQQPFESLRDFILQAEEVSSKLGLEQEDIIETIKNNARPAARRALLGHEFASVTELLQSPFVEEEYEDNDLSQPAVQAIMAEIKKLQVQQVRFAESKTQDREQSRQRSQSRDRSDRNGRKNYQQRGSKPWFNPSHQEACGKCGIVFCRGDHKCYARGKTCYNCQKMGHLKPMCHDLKK